MDYMYAVLAFVIILVLDPSIVLDLGVGVHFRFDAEHRVLALAWELVHAEVEFHRVRTEIRRFGPGRDYIRDRSVYSEHTILGGRVEVTLRATA